MSHKRKNKGSRPFIQPRDGARPSRPADVNADAPTDAARTDAETLCTDESCRREDAAYVADAAPEDRSATEPQVEETVEAEPMEDPAWVRGEAEPFVCGMSAVEVEKLKTERDTYLELARRERADFDNYRKRIQREMKEMKRESLAGFLKDFFGPLEDMHRVLQESAKDQSFDALIGGVRIMEENFWRALTKAGITKIDAKGGLFDPTLHEAMAAVPSADVPPNTILEVYENGYKLDDFILRPARVIVSSTPAE